MLYAQAVAERAREAGHAALEHRIPLPGLPNPDSQLGVPLTAGGKLLRVLCVESEVPYRFHEEDKSYLEVLGGYLALAIHDALLRERTEDAEEPAPPALPPAAPHGSGPSHELVYYAGEELILVDGDYLEWALATPQNGWGGTFQMALNNGLSFQANDKNLGWIDVTTVGVGQTLGGFLGFSITDQFSGVRVSGLAGNATSYRMTDVSIARAVPEPGTLALLGLGLAGLGFTRRRKA